MFAADVQPVILAGGCGTRLSRVLPHLPKPMAPAAGRPFVEWIIRNLAQGGFRRVLISTGHLARAIEDHFTGRAVAGVEVHCIREETPLGTAGAFLHVAERSGLTPGAWLVLNGDSLAFVDWPALVARLDRPPVDGVVVARWVEDAGRYGRLEVDKHRRLTAFDEKHADRPGGALINAGIYLLRDRLLADCPPRRPLAFEQDLFPAWLDARRHLVIHPVETDFLDIGTEATLPQAEAFIRKHRGCFR
ncbi:MAG: sugar phosphate nucleotidyltransferase [Pirellulaceae bacterium]|jgi:NDP-sugar pyrophosphorylase family protein|nr:sugar phosphate nucleotidyltransferase [Pirellulaceae bacterium]